MQLYLRMDGESTVNEDELSLESFFLCCSVKFLSKKDFRFALKSIQLLLLFNTDHCTLFIVQTLVEVPNTT